VHPGKCARFILAGKLMNNIPNKENDASLLRLGGAILMGINEEWLTVESIYLWMKSKWIWIWGPEI